MCNSGNFRPNRPFFLFAKNLRAAVDSGTTFFVHGLFRPGGPKKALFYPPKWGVKMGYVTDLTSYKLYNFYKSINDDFMSALNSYIEFIEVYRSNV